MVLTADGDLLWHQELWPTSPPFSCFRQEPVANVLLSSRLGAGHFSKRDFWGLFSTANCFGSYQLNPPPPKKTQPQPQEVPEKNLPWRRWTQRRCGDFKRRALFYRERRAASLKACGCLKRQGTACSDFPPMWSQQWRYTSGPVLPCH